MNSRDALENIHNELSHVNIRTLTNASLHNFEQRLQTILHDIQTLQESYNVNYSRFIDISNQYQEYRRRQPSSINELIALVSNTHQKDTLIKISPSYARAEEDQIYMNSFTLNTSTERRLQNVAGTFEILGCMRKGVRTHYDIKLFKPNTNEKGSFWCNCSDHKFNSSKQNKVCKHICFVVCKLGKILDPNFFETKQLSEEHFQKILEKATDTNTFRDCTLCRVPDTVTIELFQEKKKTITEDDTCPICYDAFTENINEFNNTNNLSLVNTCLSCPNCYNYVHKECMHVWLERKDTCVYCRNDIWKKYKTANRMVN